MARYRPLTVLVLKNSSAWCLVETGSDSNFRMLPSYARALDADYLEEEKMATAGGTFP